MKQLTQGEKKQVYTLLSDLHTSVSWEVYQEVVLRDRIEELHKKLEVCTLEQLRNIQGQIEGIRYCIDKVKATRDALAPTIKTEDEK